MCYGEKCENDFSPLLYLNHSFKFDNTPEIRVIDYTADYGNADCWAVIFYVNLYQMYILIQSKLNQNLRLK